MSGPRHTGWMHTRLVGDRDRAKALVPAARKLLGFCQEQAAKMGLPTYQVTQPQSDGSVIVAELIAGQPRVTINAAPAPAPEASGPPAGGFVVYARTEALPDGIDEDYPQQVIREDGDSYQTHVKTRSIALGRRDGGTYGGRFPAGLTRAGNVDWTNARGERISWYGPSSRMFMDAYINPTAQWGKFVFMLGEALLDVEQYLVDSPGDGGFTDRWIVGAGIKIINTTAWLYTVQSGAADGVTDLSDLVDGGGRFAYPLAPQVITGGVHRYRLSVALDGAGVARYSVVAGTREKLVNINLGHPDPWFFNPEMTELGCHSALPPGLEPQWQAAWTFDPTNLPDAFDDAVRKNPGAAQTHTRLAIDDDGVVTLIGQTDYSVVSAGAAVPLCSDYAVGGIRQFTVRLDAGLVPWLGLGAAEIALWQVTRTGDFIDAMKRWIVYASPRDGLLVALREHRIFNEATSGPGEPGETGDGLVLEVWRDGALEHSETPFPAPAPPFGFVRTFRPNTEMLADLAGVSITPAWFVWGVLQTFYNTTEGPPDETPVTWGSYDTFIGCCVTYALLAHPAAAWFGTYDRALPPPGPHADRPPTPISTLVAGGFSGNRADVDGIYSTVGCAATAKSVLLSVALPTTGDDRTLHYASRASLPALTGITGASRRYHPIWLLGRPPLAA